MIFRYDSDLQNVRETKEGVIQGQFSSNRPIRPCARLEKGKEYERAPAPSRDIRHPEVGNPEKRLIPFPIRRSLSLGP